MSTHPIDIVIPWVDGSDPVWQADHAKYRASKSADNHPARYREWGLFRYWFRGIEQNAPWVRKVHLLTYGHLPAWLEPDHPKLHIVNHRDFIPEEYLPTFSSHAIELNMHRIPDLAEHFLYFNDDVFLGRPVTPWDLMNLRHQQFLYASWPVPDCSPRCTHFPAISRRPLRDVRRRGMRWGMRHPPVSLRPRRLPPPHFPATSPHPRPAGQLRSRVRE